MPPPVGRLPSWKSTQIQKTTPTPMGSHLGLTITSTPQGRFVYWKGMEPSKLLDESTRLVAYIQEVPYQEGKPLASITEGEGQSVLVDYSSSSGKYSSERQVCMASIRDHVEDDEPRREYDDELLIDISANESTANAPQDKDEERKRAHRVKNAKQAKRRQNAEARTRHRPQHNLNGAFAAAADCEYATPSGNIMEATTLLQLPQNPETQRVIQLAQCALI
jgi:hypothetical protein